MTSAELRATAKAENFYLWQIAKAIGVHEMTFYNWLRDDVIPQTREERINKALEKLRQQRGEF